MKTALLAMVAAGLLRASTPQAAPALFKISGVVVSEQTNQPLKHAYVTITQSDHRDRTASLFTGADGRFTFTDVPAGKFELQANYRSTQRSLDQQDDNYSTAVITGAGIDSEHIVFRFPLLGSIALKVQDDDGDPVPGAQAYLFGQRVRNGRLQMLLQHRANARNDGSLHIASIEAGTYYLAVAARPWYAQASIPGQDNGENKLLDMAYPVTYYPNAASPSGAAAIRVGPGERLSLQMNLQATPAIHIAIEGLPMTSETGARRRPFSFVEASGPEGVRFPLPINGGPQQEDSFVVSGLAPGSYAVSFSLPSEGRAPDALGTARINATGDMQLNVNDLPRTSVGGKIALEGGGAAAGVELVLAEVATGNSALCRAAATGDFKCREGRGMGAVVQPGRYRVGMFNAGEYYVKSLVAQGAAFTNGLLNVTEGSAVTLAVEAGRGLTKLNGTALLNNKPLAGAMVLLVPRDGQSGFDIFRDQSDSDGTFSILNVRPGHFLLIAIDHGRDLAYYDAGVLAPYLENAVKIDIPAASEQAVTVNVQARRP